MLADHEALVRSTLVMHMFFVPQGLARKGLIDTRTQLRVAVAAIAFGVTVVQQGDTTAHAAGKGKHGKKRELEFW